MILFDSVTYYKLESKDLVDLKCDTCSTVYQKTKRDFYYSAYNRKTKRINFKIKNYCSKKCIEISYDINKKTHKCLQCNKKFVARITENRKFCNNSCCATYNNLKKNRNKLVNCNLCKIEFRVWKCKNQKTYTCKECFNNKKNINKIKIENHSGTRTRVVILKECEQCSSKFETKGVNSKFCSDKCKYQSYRKYDTVCKGCNIIFKSERKDAKFCTNSCKSINLNLSSYAHKAGGRSRSKIELFVEDKLKTDFPEIKFSFNDKTTIGLELDVYIPELKIAIEYNGIVHYEPIYGENKLNKVQNNDKQKMIRCYNSGIELIVIPLGKKGISKSQRDEIYKEIYKIIDVNKHRNFMN